MENSQNATLMVGIAVGLFSSVVVGALVGAVVKAMIDAARYLAQLAKMVVMVSFTLTVILLAAWGMLDLLSGL